jgi:CzcA family heavy metal efflux pump
MLRWIVSSCLKFRLLVIPVAAALMFVGIAQLRHAPVDVLPEFTPPTVAIQTEALGLSAAEVEQFVTVPMEQDLLNGVPWLDQIRSDSTAGLSSITLQFTAGTDVLRARQAVQERLTQAVALPHVSKAPVMVQPVSSTNRVVMIGLSAKDISLMDMSVLARWRIRPRLMGVPGVANVSIWGQRERQLQVQVDPAQLVKSHVSLTQVVTTTGNALWVSPLTFVEASTPGTGGFIDTTNQRLSIQHVLPIRTAADLAQVRVEDTADDNPLRLGDVATVVEDHQPLIGDAVVDNGPGLMLVVEKFPGANTREVTRAVEETMRGLQPGLSGVKVDTTVYRPATFIDRALGNLGLLALLGLLLAVVALGLLLFDWRAAVVGLVVIPLSMIAAAFVLYLRHTTFNTMTLAGLVLALGAVVDDAVVSVDAIGRRLRRYREEPPDADGTTSGAVVDTVVRTRGGLIYATLVLLVAAAPFLFLPGLAGSFSRPLVISFMLAVLASTVVALMVTPALSLLVLAKAPPRRRESPLLRRLGRGHAALFDRAGTWPRLVAVAAVLLLAGGFALLPLFGGHAFLPASRDRDLLVHLQASPGVSGPEMVRVTGKASTELRAIPGVRGVGAHVGRAITSDLAVSPNDADIWVSIAPDADYDRTVARVRNVVDGYPGLTHEVSTYPDQRVRAAATGTSDDIVVRVFGKDLDVLATKADEIRRLMAGTAGVVAPRVDLPAQQPTIEIEVNLAAAQRYGIRPGDVRRDTAILLSGLQAGSLFEDQKVFDVVVWGVPAARESLTSIRELLIDTPSGGHVRLADVADVRIRPNPAVIRHDSVSRRVDVAARVRGRDVAAVEAELRSKLTQVSFPLEYHAEVLGAPAKTFDTGDLLGPGVAAAVLVLLLLQAAFGSWRLAAALFLALPIAMVGGLLAALAAGTGLPLGAVLGLFLVWGLAVHHSTGLVRTYQWLEAEPAAGPGVVARGSAQRFAPIVVTAVTLAAAVAPLALSGAIAGTELLRPFAVVVLGGLVTTTLFSLFVVPALYLLLHGRTGTAPPEAASPEPVSPEPVSPEAVTSEAVTSAE